ncbi:MAG: hypothetical protein HZA53_05100 [Planctomycetes bacterium]|nr:hypothetical protein [Planctomycetota bacterium]
MKKSRMMLLALALSSASAVFATTLTPAVTAQGERTPAEAQETEFTKLEKEYVAAKLAWDAAVKEAKAKQEKAPSRIEPAFWARFEVLANQGDKQALAWCVRFLKRANLTNAELAAKAPSLHEKLLDAMLKDEQSKLPFTLTDFLTGIVPQSVDQQYLTVEQAQALFARAKATAKADDTQAAALLASLSLPNRAIQDEGEREQKDLAANKAVAQKFPKTPSGTAARGFVNRVENLVEGKPVLDFTTKDVEDVEFKLSDYRGKVVLLDFWGFW